MPCDLRGRYYLRERGMKDFRLVYGIWYHIRGFDCFPHAFATTHESCTQHEIVLAPTKVDHLLHQYSLLKEVVLSLYTLARVGNCSLPLCVAG